MKQKPIRSPKHLARLRKMDCMITKDGENCNQTPVIGHHLTFLKGQRGISQKVGDNWCVNLCMLHHGNLHYIGEKTFWAFHDFTLDDVMEHAAMLWKETLNY